MNNQLKSKFFNRFARFDRDNQCIVVEFNDGAEGQIEKIDGEYILDSNGIIDADIITAIDIMLEIESKTIEMIQKGKSPFTLTFFKHREEKLCRYDICTAKQGLEQLLTAELENINAKYRTVVFVLESPEQQDNLFALCEYCFVWREEGEYHFYKEVKQ